VRSLKAVLLHNGNMFPSVPIAYSTSLKETYPVLKHVLSCIQYSTHQWQIVADLKIVALLNGMQLGYVKNGCYLCTWDSRGSNQYARKEWPMRAEGAVGTHNVVNAPLVPAAKIQLPPLHIKLGLFKNFVKAFRYDSCAYTYLRKTFPKVSEAKIREGVFIGPQIRKLLNADDGLFESMLTADQSRAWVAFRSLCVNVLGNNLATGYKAIVRELLDSYAALEVHMSTKIHFLNSHLDELMKSKRPLGEVSDEQGERFHQDVAYMEKRYTSSTSKVEMLADYCWTLRSDDSTEHSRKRKRVAFESNEDGDNCAEAECVSGTRAPGTRSKECESARVRPAGEKKPCGSTK
jgi:hypothetical protein